MKSLTITLIALIYCFYGFSQNFNRPVPNGLFQYEYSAITSFSNGYFLATPTKLFTQPSDPGYVSPYPVIFDSDGYVVWYSKPIIGNAIDFKYFENDQVYVYTYIKQGVPAALVMDEQFNAVDTLFTNAVRDVHDLQIASNGNWIICTAYFDTMDLSAYSFNGITGSTNTNVKGFGYEEIDQAGNLIASWNCNNHISPTETYDFWGYDSTTFDYCHGNALDEDSDGNFLISYRHLNAVHKINRQTGDVMWRLGGELSDFTFVNDGGFSGQHDIRAVNGEYTLFDNGNMTGGTRAVTYALDTVNWTATKTNEYIHPLGATSNAMGSYRINDLETVCYGFILRPEPSAVILDTLHNSMAEYYFEDSVVSYRLLNYNLNLPTRPEITCNWNGANWELSTLNPHNTYAWSTGESTASILLTQPGTYQVWVDQGIGLLGSIPIEVTDINNPCSLGLSELENDDSVYKIIDITGSEIADPQPNKVYFKVFESGRVEKIVFIK